MNPLLENLSDRLQSAQFAALFLDALLKSLVVLGLAGGVCALWRRASAATRHLIWFLAVASLPCLPLLNSPAQKPVWTISTAANSGNQISLALELAPKASASATPSQPDAPKISTTDGTNGGSRKIAAHFNAHWMLLGWLAWLAGSIVVLIRMAGGHFYRRQFTRKAQPMQAADWTALLREACQTLNLRRAVALLHSADEVMPMTWGWLRPVILLPAEAAEWPIERRRVVLLHELAHIKRRDYLTQVVAQWICAIYWFNPLVWLAARQMRAEREGACDDLVLSGGCKASDYANHLVEIAGSFGRVPQMAAIAMARSAQLQGRIAAIVDASRNRRLRSAGALAVLAVIGSIAVCLGGSGINPNSGTDKSDALRQQQIARLRVFSKQKERQSETLAAAAGEKILPEFAKFFKAAMAGNWQTVTNMYESFKERHPQYGNAKSEFELRTSYWGPVLEIGLAYDHVVRCEPIYTQMAVDDIIHSIPAGSIYFGGTDPGRGLPTAFCKSQVDADPFYTLTQNALADGTYLEYLQRTYGNQRESLSALAEACRKDDTLQALNTQYAVAVRKLGALTFNDPHWKEANEVVGDLWGKRYEAVEAILARFQASTAGLNSPGPGQRAPKPLYIPTSEDSQRCFQEYSVDARERLENHQLKPGENVKVENGRVELSGQVAVMTINGLLVKTIVDKNPGRECFIEQSFPIDSMYPCLEPHGLIFKLNRQPLSEISDAMVRQDRDFWQPRVNQMIGEWLTDGTPVADVVGFAEKVFLRHDLAGFGGDARFVQNDYASRMFSKLRASIAGLYAWRAEHADDPQEKQRMAQAADFAFRQAVALCPTSPEGSAAAYVEFLRSQHREADARLVIALSDRIKGANSLKASVFQIRLAHDAFDAHGEFIEPTDTTESMAITNIVQPGSRIALQTFNVDKTVLLDQTAVKSARSDKNALGYPIVEILFTGSGSEQFAEITRQHLHQKLAMVIDGKLWSAPLIQAEITGGEVQITGKFSEEEAKDLAAKINEAAGK